jgi:hypothetical protein
VKVTVNAGGRVVEIESTEDGMNVHRLANIAVATWRRTEPGDGEDLGSAYGFTSQIDHAPRGRRYPQYGDRQLDAS